MPHTSSLPPAVRAPTMACDASAIGLAKLSADWYFRSAASKNCCWMRCSSMVGDDKSACAKAGAASRRARLRRRTRRAPIATSSPSIATTSKRHGGTARQRSQVVLRGEHQALLLARAHAGQRAADARRWRARALRRRPACRRARAGSGRSRRRARAARAPPDNCGSTRAKPWRCRCSRASASARVTRRLRRHSHDGPP